MATPNGQSADLRSDFSSSLASQAQAVGQPLATINRHLFDGYNKLALSLSNWQNSSQLILNQNSIVNLGAKAVLDTNSRIVVITVEIYYTGTQSASTNQLNIALLQNNIIAPQSNYNQNIENNFFIGTGMYEHMHVLRHLITGQWGQTINVEDGPFIRKEYTYQIPNEYRNLDVDLNDLEFAIFINEDEKEVLNAISITPEFGEIEAANINENENSVVLYPNPSQLGEKISIKTKNKDVDQVLILDVTGKKVFQSKNFHNECQIELNSTNFKTGVYFVKTYFGKKISSKKFIILR
ncbi:MAG: Omp28-related outer membrane protein [Flavobacteriales bacterium]